LERLSSSASVTTLNQVHFVSRRESVVAGMEVLVHLVRNGWEE